MKRAVEIENQIKGHLEFNRKLINDLDDSDFDIELKEKFKKS